MCILIFIFNLQDVKHLLFFIIYQYKSKTFTDFIPNYKKENKEMQKKQKLKEEKKKQNINTQSDSNEINRLKSELEKLKIENEKLKSDLLKANKIISGYQNNPLNIYYAQLIL